MKVFELSLLFSHFSARRPALYSFPEARVSELGCPGRISYLVPQPWLIDSDLQTLDRVALKEAVYVRRILHSTNSANILARVSIWPSCLPT